MSYIKMQVEAALKGVVRSVKLVPGYDEVQIEYFINGRKMLFNLVMLNGGGEMKYPVVLELVDVALRDPDEQMAALALAYLALMAKSGIWMPNGLAQAIHSRVLTNPDGLIPFAAGMVLPFLGDRAGMEIMEQFMQTEFSTVDQYLLAGTIVLVRKISG